MRARCGLVGNTSYSGQGATWPSAGVGASERDKSCGFEVGFSDRVEGFRAMDQVGAVLDTVRGHVREVH